MASAIEESAPPPSMVGNAFVEQYYNMLCQAPENVHKFYQNTSVISRPNDDGSMSSASSLDGIDKMILSLDCKNCHVEILTADSQASIGKGVIVLVTGFYTGIDGIKRKFSQIFFLVPQETNEYFVLNDVFRYVDASGFNASIETIPAPNEANGTPLEDNHDDKKEEKIVGILEAMEEAKPEACEKLELERSNHCVAADELKLSSPENHEDAPKKSYASVVNSRNLNSQPFQQWIAPIKRIDKQEILISVQPTVQPPHPPRVQPVTQTEAVKGHSIFVANLPMNASIEDLKEVFEKFGSIKPDGIQVRSYRQEKNCFGFVEFESAESMHSALKVTSIMIGNRYAHIEEKKATGDGGKYSVRKSGFRGENIKLRGGFSGQDHQNGGGRGYRQQQEPVMKS